MYCTVVIASLPIQITSHLTLSSIRLSSNSLLGVGPRRPPPSNLTEYIDQVKVAWKKTGRAKERTEREINWREGGRGREASRRWNERIVQKNEEEGSCEKLLLLLAFFLLRNSTRSMHLHCVHWMERMVSKVSFSFQQLERDSQAPKNFLIESKVGTRRGSIYSMPLEHNEKKGKSETSCCEQECLRTYCFMIRSTFRNHGTVQGDMGTYGTFCKCFICSIFIFFICSILPQKCKEDIHVYDQARNNTSLR